MSADDVRLSQELRAHGLRVLSTVNQVLERQGDTEDAMQYLYELGSKHITFNAKADYIDVSTVCIGLPPHTSLLTRGSFFAR